MLVEGAEAASFFPTANEVVRAVQFARENPAVVLGVVVGLTSLSVASYYEESEEEDCDDAVTALLAVPEEPEHDKVQSDHPLNKPSDMRVGGNTSDCKASLSGTHSTETIESNRSSMTESPAAPGAEIDRQCDQLSRSCSFCNQDATNTNACCDPDWGWFIPTSPEDEHHQQDVHHQHHHAQAAAHIPTTTTSAP